MFTKETQKSLYESFQNIMGHIDTPIARRRLNIDPSTDKWLIGAREALEKAKNEENKCLDIIK